ncbi:MAG TPA: beta-propeller fold lactonase family protein, partial [Chloroflexota bacterium]|nr:beta-propeller fold lactonase family protein [Chloroflexota bacterium]
LGIDKVLVYRLDTGTGRLVPNDVPYGQVASGDGPRHLAFHPSGRFVYVINEINSGLSAFAYDGERGTLTHLHTLSTLPADFSGRSHCAQVIVHPNGRFVYGSNRGHDSIAIFAIDEESGRLQPLGHQPTQGKTPRNFNVDPSGTFLLAANQDSHTIVVFRIDGERGTLSPTGHVVETPSPSCVMFLQ